MHVKLAAQRLHSFDKATWCSQHPSRSLDGGFNNHRAELLMMLLHKFLNPTNAKNITGCWFFSERTAITGGVKGFVALKEQGSVDSVEKINAPQAHSTQGVSMVGVGEGGKLFLAAGNRALLPPILKRHF
jgi:hypothetical protein